MRGFKMTREWFIPKGATKVADKQSDAVAYFDDNSHRPIAVVFFGKQNKPVLNGWFRTVEQRERRVTQLFESRRASMAFKANLRKERTEWVPDYKVGEVLHTCWGYDQTNVEFFEVVEVRGKHVILREIAQKREATGWEQGTCEPVPGKYIGEPIRKLAGKTGVTIDKVRSAHRGGNGKHRWSSYA